jgi:hypothetical protein
MAYTPSIMPSIQTVEELRVWVQNEFARIVQMQETEDVVRFNVLYAAPAGPIAGMVVFADGTTWNPGSGRGLYEYRTASWVKL